jgi:hypothetical protein
MAIIATVGDSKSFAPAPAGVHQGVCVDVVDMGLMKVEFGDAVKEQHKVRIAWQVDELMEDKRRFIVQKRYTLSLHEKSSLRKDLESWRGQPFTDEELKGFDLEKLLGVNAFLNIVHVVKDGRTYANVASIMPLKKGMAKITEADNYVRVKDRTPDQQTPEPNVPDEDGPPF